MNQFKSFLLFTKILFRGIRKNAISNKASSLSYITLIGIVPLFAAFASISTLFFPDYHEQLKLIFQQFLPYENSAWLIHIETFIAQARALGSLALIIFLIITLRVFMVIESNLNQLWGVQRHRNLGSRISSFTLLLFWGPVLMGLLSSLFFLLKQQVLLPGILLYLVPKSITLLTFMMLYWSVPYTRVRLISAFWGSTTTTTCLIVGQWGFLAYLRGMKAFAGILGSLGLVLLFFIAVNLMWFFILLGNLVAYTHQNFRALKRQIEEEDIPPDRGEAFWALAILVKVTHQFLNQKEPLPISQYAENLTVPLSRLQSVVDRLVREGLLMEAGKEGKLLLTQDPDMIRVGDIMRLLNREALNIPVYEDETLKAMIAPFFSSYNDSLNEGRWNCTIRELASGDNRSGG